MTYTTEIGKLSRSSTHIVKLTVDTSISGVANTEYITAGEIPPTENYFSCVESIDWTPSRATIEGGLGYLGAVTIKAKDFNYGPRGTYFGKLTAANPYYLNRLIEIYVGFWRKGETFSLSNFQKRTYFIKRITGPDQNGNVKIEALDALSRLKESEVPLATQGALNASLTDVATGSTNITDNTGFAAGGGYAMIGSEIVAYSGVTGGDSITISTRGQGGTDAEAHDATDPVRNIYQAAGNVIDEIRTLIEDFTDIDHATYIDDTAWNTERDTFLASESVELWVTEPTSVDKIIDKLANQSYLNMWWDDENQDIRVKALGPSLTSILTWTDEDNILDAKISIKRDQRQVLTGVWIYYGKLDKTGSNSAQNFDSIYINEDTGLQTALGEEKIKKLYADYLPNTGSATASKISGRLIEQNRLPIEISLYVDAKDSAVQVGDAITLVTSILQDVDGYSDPVICRVIERAEKENNRYFYKLIKTGQEATDRYKWISNTIAGVDDLGDYTTESIANQNKYAFICDTDDEMSNGDDPYLIL